MIVILYIYRLSHYAVWQNYSVDSVDFIILLYFCMPVSAVVRLGMICLYVVIASNQINKI